MKKIIVSIIVPNFNTKEVTLRCIKSIVENTKISYEIIVVDNGSTDGSQDAIRNLQFTIFNLQTIFNEKNLGFARAVNQGIKIAKGKYILLLNSDVFTQKESIEKMVDFAEKTPNCGVVGGKLVFGSGETQHSVMIFPTLWQTINKYWLGKKDHVLSQKVTVVDAVVGAVFLITPEARKKVGLLDERYFMYFEDLDYCRRVKKAGLATYYLPEAEFTHLHGESGRGLARAEDQWRRLIPSSQIYHGRLVYYLITLVIWTSQKIKKVFS